MSQRKGKRLFRSRDERWRVFVQKALSRLGRDRCQVTANTAMSGVPQLGKHAQGAKDNVVQQRMDQLTVPPMERQEESPLQSPVKGAQNQGATNMNMPRQKVYFVEGPPPGYQAAECTSCPKLDGATSGGEECGAISGGEEDDGHVPIKKHRNRQRKRKRCASEHSASQVKPTPKLKRDLCANGSSESDDTRASAHDPKLTKNQRRKLKKRRHRDRLRASLTCAEQNKDTVQCVPALRERERSNMVEGSGDDLNSSTLSTEHTSASEMFLELLDFLQATWEIYSRDGKRECAEMEQQWKVLKPLLEALESGSLNLADLSLLARLKALVKLGDMHAKENALEMFQQESCLPDDDVTFWSDG
uniref:Glutamate-rich protein 1 n=1 Tax=Eptatretus burgeri TaxID=7764 RepID=A0A8C4WXI9_EPTBU